MLLSRKAYSLIVSAAVLVLWPTSSEMLAAIYFRDGLTHIIDYEINDYVWVDWMRPGKQTTLILVDGGRINYLQGFYDSRINILGGWIGSLTASENSQVHISAGSIGGVTLKNKSQLEISGGSIGGDLWAGWASQVKLFGGSIAGNVWAYGPTDPVVVDIFGGSIAGDLCAAVEGIITIHGSDFALDYQPFGYAQLIGPYGGYQKRGYLTGTLTSGDSIDNKTYLGYSAKIIVDGGPASPNLEGIVSDRVTSLPIGSATVNVPRGRGGIHTNSLGEFSFANLPTGQITITVTKTGYYDASETVMINQGSVTYVDILMTPLLGPEVAELAKQVIGGDYLWGGKGFGFGYHDFLDADMIRKHYTYKYWNDKIGGFSWGSGLDCSGLVFWAYNRAYGATNYQKTSSPYNPVHYEGADGQYRLNSTPIQQSELMTGDLLFFNTDSDPEIDHVEMYVGDFPYPGGVIRGTNYPAGTYNVVSSRGANYGIVPYELTDRLTQAGNTFVGFGRVTDPIVGGTATAQCPVDIILTDPEGFTINKDIWEVPGVLYYSVFDIDGDDELDDMVTIPEMKTGLYLIIVDPEPDALPTDTYTFEFNSNGQTLVLADDVAIMDIPDQPYMVRSTPSEIIPIIPATIDVDPDTFNLKGEGKWVTVYIELPTGHGYNVSDIDLGRTFLEGLLEVQHSDVQDAVLMVKFDRQDLIIFLESVVGIIPPDEIPLAVIGELKDGRRFEGSETIRVIDEPAPIEGSIHIDHTKIDFKKKPDDDKVSVGGKLELDLVNGDGVDISEDVIVTVGPLSETITMGEMGKKGEKWEYKCPKHGEGNIKHMTIEWKNGKFDIHMDKADLSGITNPVTISVQIGDDVGSESILMREKKHHWDYKAGH